MPARSYFSPLPACLNSAHHTRLRSNYSWQELCPPFNCTNLQSFLRFPTTMTTASEVATSYDHFWSSVFGVGLGILSQLELISCIIMSTQAALDSFAKARSPVAIDNANIRSQYPLRSAYRMPSKCYLHCDRRFARKWRRYCSLCGRCAATQAYAAEQDNTVREQPF